MPMYLQIVVFTVQTCIMLSNKGLNLDISEGEDLAFLCLEVFSFALALYFLIIEIIKIVGFCKMTNRKAFAKQKYFESIWELSSPIMIMIVQTWSTLVGIK